MKKIELHLHLDGSLDRNYCNYLMNKNVTNQLISTHDSSLNEYLDKFKLPIELLQSKENIENFSYLLAKDLVNDEVIYAEVRFCPLFHLKYCSIDEVVEAIIDGFKKVKNIKINIIFCMMRNFDYEKNVEIIHLTKKFLNKGVVGIDLAGDEEKYKTQQFKSLFDIINNYNIPFTIHAGEADNWESVDSAIRFNAKRIGHGVNSIYNDNTIKNLIKNKITLEICPKSNIDTNIFPSYKFHPIKKLYDMGVLVTINTDNRTVSNINLNKEYNNLKKEFGFTNKDFLNFNINAVNCAFISDVEKKQLKKILYDDYNEMNKII